MLVAIVKVERYIVKYAQKQVTLRMIPSPSVMPLHYLLKSYSNNANADKTKVLTVKLLQDQDVTILLCRCYRQGRLIERQRHLGM